MISKNIFQTFCIETIIEKCFKREKNAHTLTELLGRLIKLLRDNSKCVLKLPITFCSQKEVKSFLFNRYALELFN